MTTGVGGIVEAEELLRMATTAYRAALGERLLAAYALGSLAHGGFSPLVSDVDLGLIVEDPLSPSDLQTIEGIAAAQKASAVPLSERLSVFWGTPMTLAGLCEGGRFPALDRLDLLENGRLLTGIDARSGLPRPSAANLLVAGAEFALDYLAGVRWAESGSQSRLGSMRAAEEDAVDEMKHPDLLASAGVRRLTKLVLFPVRFMFTAATERVGTNAEAVAWYLDRADAVSKPLVAAALAWRAAEPKDYDEVVGLLREQILPLYLYYIDDHIMRLDRLGKVELSSSFIVWRARLA